MTHDRVDTRRMIMTLACWHTNRMGTPDIWFARQCVEIGLQRRPGNQKRISRRICWSGARDCIWCSFGLDQRLLLKNMSLRDSLYNSTRRHRVKCCSTFPHRTARTSFCPRLRICLRHNHCKCHPRWCSLGQQRSHHNPVRRQRLLSFVFLPRRLRTRFALSRYLCIFPCRNRRSLTDWTRH